MQARSLAQRQAACAAISRDCRITARTVPGGGTLAGPPPVAARCAGSSGGNGGWHLATAPSAAWNTTTSAPGSARAGPCRSANEVIQPGKRSGATSIQRGPAAGRSLGTLVRVATNP